MHARRSLCSNLIALVLLFAVLTSTAWAADRKVIGIADFEANGVAESALASTITSFLSEDIVTNRSFQLLHHAKLMQKLASAGLATNLYEKSSYLQPEQLHDVHFLVTGIIKDVNTQVVQLNGFQQHRARVLLTVRVVHVPAAQVVYAETLIGEARQTSLLDKRETDAEASANRKVLLETAAKRAIARVSAKLHSLNPMTGVVLQVHPTDNTVVIDLGAEQSVAVGQDYMIYEEGAMLVHPMTNLELGRENREVATARITKVDTLHAIAHILRGRISEIVPGLQVKRLPLPTVIQN